MSCESDQSYASAPFLLVQIIPGPAGRNNLIPFALRFDVIEREDVDIFRSQLIENRSQLTLGVVRGPRLKLCGQDQLLPGAPHPLYGLAESVRVTAPIQVVDTALDG